MRLSRGRLYLCSASNLFASQSSILWKFEALDSNIIDIDILLVPADGSSDKQKAASFMMWGNDRYSVKITGHPH